MGTLSGYKFLSTSVPEEDAGIRIRISEGGNVRGRRAFAAPVVTYRVLVAVTAAEKTTLLAFYEANKDDLNELTIDGVTYDFLFASKPQTIEKNGEMRTMAFDIVGHAQ